jgi:hypothetical protein
MVLLRHKHECSINVNMWQVPPSVYGVFTPLRRQVFLSYSPIYEEQAKESLDVQRIGRHFFGNNNSKARGNTGDDNRTGAGAVRSAAPFRTSGEAASRKLMQR